MAAQLNKEYAPIGGEGDFCKESAKLAFGADSAVVKDGLNVTIQVNNSFYSEVYIIHFDHFPRLPTVPPMAHHFLPRADDRRHDVRGGEIFLVFNP